ncbi:DNA topoisomerase I [Candidatus Acidianus copahuensis]|uniref:DNA topoisomerase I n=1 Tax=Candidatus Acidianus copahuensis TaxID=1160895 RepID=UPI000A6257B3|nr:DNA topoisomerase I [Candidatus Acidianus copahuensis]
MSISCSPKDYTLLIAEKPKAAKKIVEAFSKYQQCNKGKAYYWIVRWNGSPVVIASAVGHLFDLNGKSGFPVFEAEWRPIYEINKKAYYTKKYYDLLRWLSSNAKQFINACDYDIEGSVIGYMIIKTFGDLRKAKRMKYSTLTKQEIITAIGDLQPLDIYMVEAGIARHLVDWIWGINVSRALMKAVKSATSKRIILSAGRVQSPSLIQIIKNDIDRSLFVPLPYFKIRVKLDLGKEIYAYLDQDFENKEEAKSVARRIKKEELKVEEVKQADVRIPRPVPFNLGDLQVESGRFFGFSPYKTERLAEELYLNGMISYPRTNSQKIPPSINVGEIIRGLREGPLKKYVQVFDSIVAEGPRIRQGQRDDPAHPAIYPTGYFTRVSKDAYRLYDLIVRRFLASASLDAIVRKQDILLRFANGYTLSVGVQSVIEKGWTLIYPRDLKSEDLFNVKKGDKVGVLGVNVVMYTTKPSVGLSRISLLKWMEESKIGTEATRGKIIETLFLRKYVKLKGGYIIPTTLGLTVGEVLDYYFRDLTSVKMTSEMESELELIKYGKKNKDDVIKEVKERISKQVEGFAEKEVGEKIAKGLGLIQYKKCAYCDLEVEKDGLCKYHRMALAQLEKIKIIWEDRSAISEEEAIKRIAKLKTTGKLIKDIIENKWKDDVRHAR